MNDKHKRENSLFCHSAAGEESPAFIEFLTRSIEKLKTMIKKLFINLIRFYQKYISPIKGQSCRFHPTCSEYAVLSIEKYGIIKGSLKAIWRILRCNPFSKGGVDYP